MKRMLFFTFLLVGAVSCIEKYGRHYHVHGDYESLCRVVRLIDVGADTNYVKKILGTPIDMGFEYRYLTDSVSEEGCVVGAVFRLRSGRVDSKDIVPLCE